MVSLLTCIEPTNFATLVPVPGVLQLELLDKQHTNQKSPVRTGLAPPSLLQRRSGGVRLARSATTYRINSYEKVVWVRKANNPAKDGGSSRSENDPGTEEDLQ
uniref:Secreted protein n=1 Tax=Ascaris lumbricoides TaxID=6252 RepID=A0A0M3IF20_ASCLU